MTRAPSTFRYDIALKFRALAPSRRHNGTRTETSAALANGSR
jgi:hypothetical protein